MLKSCSSNYFNGKRNNWKDAVVHFEYITNAKYILSIYQKPLVLDQSRKISFLLVVFMFLYHLLLAAHLFHNISNCSLHFLLCRFSQAWSANSSTGKCFSSLINGQKKCQNSWWDFVLVRVNIIVLLRVEMKPWGSLLEENHDIAH